LFDKEKNTNQKLLVEIEGLDKKDDEGCLEE